MDFHNAGKAAPDSPGSGPPLKLPLHDGAGNSEIKPPGPIRQDKSHAPADAETGGPP
jgi:hypothetical protein